MRNSIRILLALTVLACLAALLLMPGATTAVVVRTPSGKQSVRFISFISILAMAAAVCQGLVHVPTLSLHGFRAVMTHGFGPDLLDKTCVRLC